MIFMNSSFLKLICYNKEWELIHILVLDGALSNQVQSILSCCNQLQHPLKIKLTNHIQRWRLTIAVVLALVLLIFQVFTNFSKVKATEIGKYTFVTRSKTIPYAFLERWRERGYRKAGTSGKRNRTGGKGVICWKDVTGNGEMGYRNCFGKVRLFTLSSFKGAFCSSK